MSTCLFFASVFLLAVFIIYMVWSNDTSCGKELSQSFKTRSIYGISLGSLAVLCFILSCAYDSARELRLSLFTPGGVAVYRCEKQTLAELGIDLKKTKPLYFEEWRSCSQYHVAGSAQHTGPCDSNKICYMLIFKKSDIIKAKAESSDSKYDKLVGNASRQEGAAR